MILDRIAPAHITIALGAAILLLTAIASSLHVPGSIWVGTILRKDIVVALMLVSAAIWAIAVWRTMHAPPPLAAILAIAAALRLTLLFCPPFMSSDIYRYVWDGKVQAAGINPYRYIAADPALAPLRDDRIYPRINRVDYAHTIYPPAAQLIFAAVGRLHPTLVGMKSAMLLLEAFGIAAMLALLQQAALPLSRILIYAWNPLPVWAIALDGHIDAATIGLIGLTLLAAIHRNKILTGILFALAILTKLFPLALAPALRRRYDYKLPAVTIAAIAALYALYASVGWHVLGFLPAYTSEEGLRSGPGFWALGALGHFITLPPWAGAAYIALALAALTALAIWIAIVQSNETKTTPLPLARNCALLAMATTAAISPHYPWYYTWLALPACLVPWPSLLWLASAPLFLYCDPFHDEILIPTTIFVPAAVLAGHDLWRAAHHRAQAGA